MGEMNHYEDERIIAWVSGKEGSVLVRGHEYDITERNGQPQ